MNYRRIAGGDCVGGGVGSLRTRILLTCELDVSRLGASLGLENYETRCWYLLGLHALNEVNQCFELIYFVHRRLSEIFPQFFQCYQVFRWFMR